MHMSRIAVAALLAVAGGAVAAQAAPPIANKGTVNAYTRTQEARARREIRNAGYQPTALEFVQAGNFFFNATKGNDQYSVTVVPDGKVYASTPLPK